MRKGIEATCDRSVIGHVWQGVTIRVEQQGLGGYGGCRRKGLQSDRNELKCEVNVAKFRCSDRDRLKYGLIVLTEWA